MFVPELEVGSSSTPASSGAGGSSAPAPASSSSATPAAAAAPAPKSTGLDRLREKIKVATEAKPGSEGTKETSAAKVANPAGTTTTPPAAKVENPPGTTTTPPGEGAAAVVDGGEAKEWTPNWKFKVMDKEHEIPEWVRKSAENPEHEKYLREIHEKALGLDVVKPRLVESQKQLKKVVPELQQFQASKQELINHYKRGDFDSFFKSIGVTEEKVLQWAVGKAQLHQMPEDQRMIHEQATAADRRAYALEQELARVNGQNEATATQARKQEFQVELAKPDVVALSKAFDEAAGTPNAFINEVIEIGSAAWNRDQTVLTPAQAVQMAVAKYGKFIKPTAAATADPTPPAASSDPGLIPPAPAPGARAPNGQFATKPGSQTVPTLPNAGSKSGSPVGGGKKIRSIEDIKNYRKEHYGS